MKRIFLLIAFLFTFTFCNAQLANLNDPIRKDEQSIRSMMKGYSEVSEAYGQDGKTIYFTYHDYRLMFGLDAGICHSVFIVPLNNFDLDATMYKWLYEKKYEKANGLWGKMIVIPEIKNAEYPVGVQNINDNTGTWWIFDILYYSKRH